MIVCAIDPGPTESAVVFWDGEKVLERRHLPNEELLSKLKFLDLWFEYDLLAIETIQCFGMPAGEEMFMTMFWVGRFVQRQDKPHILVKRSEVKMALCNSMRAKDANIRQALIDRFGKPGTKKAPGTLHGISNHLWSALAIAVVAHQSHNPPRSCP